jgi:uncharacterized protein (DUF169 family)
MKELYELGRELKKYTNIDTSPVAITFLKNKSEIPEGTRRPLKDLKTKIAPCQAQAMARKYGWSVAMTDEDMGCAIASHTYGFEPADMEAAAAFFTKMNYASDSSSALEILKGFKIMKPGACEAVVYSPLERAKIMPDVILLFLNPAQLMRCLHGSTRNAGKPVSCTFTGRAASCTEGVLGAFIDQAPKVVVPGNGDRVWATVQDNEMAYAFPASHLKVMVEGLARTHEKGIRYPIPSFLKYRPEVGTGLPMTDIFKKS